MTFFYQKRWDSTTDDKNSPVSLVPGQWQHVAFTLAGSLVSIYIDGTLVVSTTTAYSTSSELIAPTVYLGFDGGWLFIGMIDEVKMFGKALSQSEISMVLAN